MKWSEILVAATIVLVTSILLSNHSNADELWGVATVHSYHFDRSKNYNEQNFGVGVEYRPTSGGKDTGLRLAFGEYKNSYSERSVYFEGAFLPIKITDGIRLGAAVVVVSGYAHVLGEFVPVALPVAEIVAGNWGANIALAPVPKGGIGLQVKYKF